MKKVLSLLLALVMVIGLLPLSAMNASAAEESATIALTDKTATRVSYSTTQQVWQQNGITLTNNKGGSSSNVGDYAPLRLYQSSEVIIEASGKTITKIEFTCNSYKSNYPADLQKSIGSAATVTVSGKVVTAVLAAPTEAFTFTLAKQVRLDSMTVYYTEAGGSEGGDTPA